MKKPAAKKQDPRTEAQFRTATEPDLTPPSSGDFFYFQTNTYGEWDLLWEIGKKEGLTKVELIAHMNEIAEFYQPKDPKLRSFYKSHYHYDETRMQKALDLLLQNRVIVERDRRYYLAPPTPEEFAYERLKKNGTAEKE